MTHDWPRFPVSAVADILSGGTPKRSMPEYWGGDIQWASAKDIANAPGRKLHNASETITEAGLRNSATKFMPSGTIIITARGTVGAMAQLGAPMAFNQTCYALIPSDDRVDNDYLFYALSSTFQNAAALSHGTIFQTITTSTFDHWEIPVPPMEEQRRIAGVLGCLDDKIELNRRMAETLEQMARALFRSWFVDFEPVRAKQEARWRPGQSLPGLPAHLYDSFPDHLEPSPLGPIPTSWRVAALDEIATFLNGLALQKFPAQGAESIPAIKIAQLRAGHTDRADPVSPDIPPQFHVTDGDILFSWSGSLELVVWAAGKGALNQHLFKVDPLGLPQWFVYHWVEQHLPEFRQIAADKATTMGHIKRRHLSDAQVVVPPSDALGSLGATSAALFDNTLRARIEARKLVAIRDAVLPRLIVSHPL